MIVPHTPATPLWTKARCFLSPFKVAYSSRSVYFFAMSRGAEAGVVDLEVSVLWCADDKVLCSGTGAYVVLDFGKNVAGFTTLQFGNTSDSAQSVGLAYSESTNYAVCPSSAVSACAGTSWKSNCADKPEDGPPLNNVCKCIF
jgi:hypothetical protein